MDNSTRDKVREALRRGFEHMPMYAASSRAMIAEALRLLDAPVAEVPAGWKLVPVEPTAEMLSAYQRCDDWLKSDEGQGYAVCSAYDNARGEPYWKVMLQAVPQPPAETVPGWKPIASAPKDGLIDILTRDGVRRCDCYYDAICDEWRTSRPSGHLISIKARHVTHWMPLPPAPEKSR